IPRPRNAFILFRSAKCQELRESNVETDHRMISRIIGDLWKTADAATKKKYQDMAAQEKEEHSRLYPGYRFNP
ncbi:high mobility group box domain-containing protein, partial [Cerioporus squamosus]